MTCCEQTPPASDRQQRLVLVAVGALGLSCVMTQLALMRELLGAFSGNEMVLGVVLGLWLLLMGLGAWLGRAAERFQNQLATLAALQIWLAILPLCQVFALRSLRNVVFIRGAVVGVTETVGATCILLLPYCLAAGFALALVCSLLVRRDGPDAVGRVYVADSIGSLVGGVLFSLGHLFSLDHIGSLALPALLNLWLAGAVGWAARDRGSASLKNAGVWLSLVALMLGFGVLGATLWGDLDGLSTRLQYAGQHVVARANSPYGKLIVTESDGQFNVIENGVPLTSTRDDQHVEETVHYALAQRPDARTVLLVSGGISGTARELLKYKVARVDYVELDPLILDLGEKYLPENLADRRIQVINTDARLFIKQMPPALAEKYDVVIIDAPPPSTAQLNRFYTVEFLAEVKRVLAADGVVSLALGQYENYVSPELARMLGSAERSLKQSFRNVVALPGSRVFFLASDGPLFTEIAARLEQRGIRTRLVNAHYLDAMLTPDRMADLVRATAQPAALNRDFSPVLYLYHLRHWLSQFNARLGPVPVVVVVVLLGIYLFHLRGSALVLFASGFAASALEMVLLLVFQVLCGSVYHQVGILVTLFMAGLAGGAALAGARWPFRGTDRKALRLLAFAIAAYALVLPLVLPLLNRMGGTAASLLALKALLGVLTLALALLVGMQFPLANQLEFGGTATAASRLYTADFVGACLGALLACTLLIPLFGVTAVCLVAGLLNLVAAIL